MPPASCRWGDALMTHRFVGASMLARARSRRGQSRVCAHAPGYLRVGARQRAGRGLCRLRVDQRRPRESRRLRSAVPSATSAWSRAPPSRPRRRLRLGRTSGAALRCLGSGAAVPGRLRRGRGAWGSRIGPMRAAASARLAARLLRSRRHRPRWHGVAAADLARADTSAPMPARPRCAWATSTATTRSGSGIGGRAELPRSSRR